MKIHRSIYLVAILLIFTIAQSSQLTFPVQHTFHRSNQRHALTAHKKQKIYHDMRVFKTVHSGQLQHQSVASQSYGLNEMGYFFTLNMTVAGIHYRLNIDTGSSNIFIKGGKAPGNPVIRFYCLQCFNTSPKYTISYLDGSLQTYQQNLKVEFGTHTFNEDILVAYTAPKQFEEAEGLVGLSFPQNTINGNSSFLQALKRNKIIDRYAFGVNLNFQQHGRSKISFGAPDPNLYEGTLKKYSIDFGLAYYIIGSGFSFAGQKKHYLPAAIFDTGNTCISIPNKYQSVILNAFNKGGNVCGFMIETSSPQFSLLRCRIRDFNALPVLTVYVKEDAYEVDKQAYMHSIYQSDDGYITDTYIQSVSNQAEIFFGDGFFNRYYTYFDLEQKEIGIAKNREVLSYENTFADSSQLDDEDRAFFNQLK